MKYTDKQVETLMAAIYDGRITQGNLPVDLYFAIADYLKKGLYEGFGGSLVDYSGKPLELLLELRENVYLFSAAKTFQSVRAIESMIKEDGQLRPFKEFKEFARKEYDLYNNNWARTEYDTAIASGQQGYRWTQIEKDADVLPYVQFTVVEDANTTIICKPLEGLIVPITSPMLKKYYPPNHFDCRTGILQLDSSAKESDAESIKAAIKHVDEHMPDSFKMNVGIDKVIFSKEHPYFDAPKKLGKDNFGLPLPEKD